MRKRTSKWYRRILPMLLSVALLFQTMPETVFAAESAKVSADTAEVLADEPGTDPGTEPGGSTDGIPKAVIRVDEGKFKSQLRNALSGSDLYEFDFTVQTGVKAQYDGKTTVADALWDVITRESSSFYADYALNFVIANETYGGVKQFTAKYQDAKPEIRWQQKGADGSYADMAQDAKPQAVGSYRIAITLAGVEGSFRAADPCYVTLEIQKAALTLVCGNGSVSRDLLTVNCPAGATVKELKEIFKDATLHDPVGGADLSAEDLPKYAALTWTVTEAGGAEALPDTEILQKNKDYYIEMTGAVAEDKKAAYEVKTTVLKVILGSAVPTEIKVTYTHPDKTIGKDYDGEALDYETLVQPEYSAKVVYTETDDQGEEKEVELEGAEITGTWCVGSRQNGSMIYEEINGAPVDAGTYYYRLSYRDENGTYAYSYAYIKAVINPVDVVIKPMLDMTVYEGMSTADVLKKVAYEVYAVKNGVIDDQPLPISDYFWGVNYSDPANDGKDQKYTPVFVIQKGTTAPGAEGASVTTWEDLATSSYATLKIEENVSYRVAFSGKKKLYAANSETYTELDINAAQKNYHVDVLPTTLEGNTVPLTVNACTTVTIDVNGIYQDGKGSALENPIVKTYDGECLYANKGEYKKAEVTSAEGSAPGVLTYNWQRVYPYAIEDEKDGEGKPTGKYQVNESRWKNLSFSNVESFCSPYNGGVYRLRVSYTDPTGATQAAPAYVYYVIQPRADIMKVEGNPAIYADGVNTVYDLLTSLHPIGETENEENAVTVSVYPITITGEQDGKAQYTLGEEALVTNYYEYFEDPWDYDRNFVVEKKVTAQDGTVSWTECDYDEVFDKDGEYRLSADNYYEFSEYINGTSSSGSSSSENIGKKLDAVNRIVKDADENDIAYYENLTVPITLKTTKGTPVKITVDESKITKNVKTYDGTPFDLTELMSLVKVETDDDAKTDVTAQVKDQLRYTLAGWSGIERDYANVIHADEYTLTIRLDTNDEFKAASTTLEKKYEIMQRELTMTYSLKTDIPAGKLASDYDPIQEYTLEGFIEGDTEVKVIDSVKGQFYRADGERIYSFYSNALSSSETYYVKPYVTYNAIEDAWKYDWDYEYYDNDYTVRAERIAFMPVRTAALVASTGIELTDKAVRDESGVFSHSIDAVDGVPFTKDRSKEGNFFEFRIYVPEEFQTTDRIDEIEPVYENSIIAAGGKVTGQNKTSNSWYVEVEFDVALGGSPSFDIYWEKDYKETFTVNLGNMVCEADLSKAVAPKSLSFSGVNTKMAVGDTQQLDVKMTKAQMNDVILLGYRVMDNDTVLKVTDTGFVTALSTGSGKKATATVEVYACEMVNGVKTRIEGKAGKSAKVKITVSDVAAPKISKVTAGDYDARVEYTLPANGYRREIYVLEGNQKADAFEAKLAEVKNGDYSGFVYAQILSRSEENSNTYINKKNVTVSVSVDSLLPGGSTYTVYVRNVSGLRTVDGGEVAASHAGTVKTFKTIKPQERGLSASVGAANKKQTIRGGYEDNDLWENAYGEEEYTQVYYYEAQLADKSAVLNVSAIFPELQSYSDSGDYVRRSLPLSGADKKLYTAPKIQYYICDVNNRRDSVTSSQRDLYVNYNGYFYLKDNSIATIAKNGKITLKGKGKVMVFAQDTDTGNIAVARLYIAASPDSVTAKSVKLAVGQTILLSDYLEYKEKKIKIADYQNRYCDLKLDAQSNEYFKFEPCAWDMDKVTDYEITALKSGKDAKLNLEVTDRTVAANGGSPAVLKLSVSSVAPVKNLKAVDVVDRKFTVRFSYPEYRYSFVYDLRDARGSVIEHKMLKDTYYDEYDPKTKQYVYEISFGQEQDITLLSSYSFSIKAVYNGEASKEAKLKIKTTNIPASYEDRGATRTGGEDIRIGRYDMSYGELSDTRYRRIKTGNAYTLELISQYGEVPRARVTDTLTWKSTNSKVATVKAYAGTYSAKLNALTQGTTTIEVTSKITKKVIARYPITVVATGDAQKYYGENEPYISSNTSFNGMVEKDYIGLDVGETHTFRLNAGEAQHFVFTAPAYGQYYISGYAYDTVTLEKNEKLYIRLANTSSSAASTATITVTADKMYSELVLGTNQVKGGEYVRFLPAVEGTYEITWKDGDTELSKEEVTLSPYIGYSDRQYTNDGTIGTDPKKVYTVTVAVKAETPAPTAP